MPMEVSSDDLLLKAARLARECQSLLARAAATPDESIKADLLAEYGRSMTVASQLRALAAGEIWGDLPGRIEPLQYARPRVPLMKDPQISASTKRAYRDARAQFRMRRQTELERCVYQDGCLRGVEGAL